MLYENENEMAVQELKDYINYRFSPIMWILEEQIFHQIRPIQKGWFHVKHLHKSLKVNSIFRKH